MDFWQTDQAWIFLQTLYCGPIWVDYFLHWRVSWCWISIIAPCLWPTSLFYSVMWALLEQLQCLKASYSDQGSPCGCSLERLELVKPCWPEQNSHFTWGRFFPYQNSDLVLKAIKISEPSSQGESLSHGIEHNVQKVLWFPVLLRAWDICQNKTIRCILFMCWSTDSAPACQPSTHLQNCKIILWRIARTLWTLAAALQPNVSKFFYQWPIPKWECSVDRKALPLPF